MPFISYLAKTIDVGMISALAWSKEKHKRVVVLCAECHQVGIYSPKQTTKTNL